MCLTVDSKFHKKCVPHVATAPILVWKWLECATYSSGQSPYMATLWHFGVAKTAKFSYLCGTQIIESGLHAFFSKNAGRITQRTIVGINVSLFPAVIPVGAQYWIGTDGEIVSNELTVYRNDEECLAAFNAKKYGKPTRRPKN